MAAWGHLGSPPARPTEDGHAIPRLCWGSNSGTPVFLTIALVHRSYCNENGLEASDSYERLEFLGDAVLELVISELLYRQFPDANEGQLTKARSSLVKGKVLAGVARRLGPGRDAESRPRCRGVGRQGAGFGAGRDV